MTSLAWRGIEGKKCTTLLQYICERGGDNARPEPDFVVAVRSLAEKSVDFLVN